MVNVSFVFQCRNVKLVRQTKKISSRTSSPVRAQYPRPCHPLPRRIGQHLASQVFRIQKVSYTDKETEPNERAWFSNLNWLFIASWENCYLETVPAHAVMTKSGHTDNAQFKRLLLGLSADYGISQTNSSGFQLFVSSKYGGSDLLFKDSTKKLVDVGLKNTYRLWLGEKYLSDLEELNSCPTESSTSPTTAFGEINKPRSTVVMVSFLSAVIATFTSQWMKANVNHSHFIW